MKRNRVLFICEGNIHRSRTAESLYAASPDWEVKSAGLVSSARIQVTEELLDWADLVVVMEPSLVKRLHRRWAEELKSTDVICLNVPDEYQYLEPQLQEALIEQLRQHLGPPSNDSAS